MKPIDQKNQTPSNYVPIEYPKYKYKMGRDGTLMAQLINTPAEEREMGGEWKNSPDEARV